MKSTLALGCLLGALLVGCGEKPGAPAKSDANDNPAAAPAEYLKSAAKSEKKAILAVDTVALNKALELFYVQEGRFPKTLDELVEKRYLPSIPPVPVGMKLSYDEQAGIARLEKE